MHLYWGIFCKAVKMLVILLNFSQNVEFCVFYVISTTTNSLYICGRINCSYSCYLFEKEIVLRQKYEDTKKNDVQ